MRVLTGSLLARRRLVGDISTHRIGTRELDMTAWVESTLVLPREDGLRPLSVLNGWQERTSVALPAAVAMTVRLPGVGALTVLMVGGAVGVVHV